MNIDAQDCLLTGYNVGRVFRCYKAEHLPTGSVLRFADGLTKREAMNRLQDYVSYREAEDALRTVEVSESKP